MFLSKPINLLIFFVIIANCFAGFAQDSPLKLGKIDKKVLEDNIIINDVKPASLENKSGVGAVGILKPVELNVANAIILSDYGHAYFEFDSQGELQFYFFRQVRVKILNKNGFDWANWEIPLYIGDNEKEKLIKVKGYTYNLVDEKVEKTKFENEIFKTNYDMHHQLAKFTFPKVKAGSVIDLEYKISSPYYHSIDPWYFQYEIPVVRSEYYFEYPDFFTFTKFMRGYISLSLAKKNKIFITVKRQTSHLNYHKMKVIEIVDDDITVNIEHFIAENVPAFVVEEPPFYSK